MKELTVKSKDGFKRMIERYQPKQGIVDYAFVCTPKKYVVTLHYMEEQRRTIHCFEGDCCKDGHKTNTYTIYLVGVYTDYKDPNAPLDLQYIRATKAVDATLRNLAEQFEDEKDFCKLDLQLYLDDSVGAEFKKIGVTPCVNGTRKATKEQLAELKEKLQKCIPYLESEIAEVVTPEEYKRLMSRTPEVKPIPKQNTATPLKNIKKDDIDVVDTVEETTTETSIDINDLDELL